MIQIYDINTDILREITQRDIDELLAIKDAYGMLLGGIRHAAVEGNSALQDKLQAIKGLYDAG